MHIAVGREPLHFNRTEQRSLVLAAGLLMLGAAARVGCGPEADDFSWTLAERPPGEDAPGLAATRQLVTEGVRVESRASTPLGTGERLDPNTAREIDLRRLPGIGAVRARAIVEERTSGGPFRVPADLVRVPGIGPRTAEKLAPYLEFRAGSDPNRPVLSARAAPVNVNRAQIKELEQITGIGPVLAARIVATRHRLGPFRQPEDLLLVPGIGPAILREIRGQIRF
jgi:competence ComEA-like helix-hairpin-helix protein